MSNVFRYVNAVNSGDVIPVENDYNQFLITRAFSYHIDTIHISNELNQYGEIEDEMHFGFLKSLVRPKKRFAKWAKPTKHREASLLSAFYQIPMIRAYEYLSFFSQQDFDEIEEQLQQKDK